MIKNKSVRGVTMLFRQFKDPEGCISYIFACRHTGDAAVVDPNHDPDIYLAALTENKLKLRYIIDTHSHADHDSLSSILGERTGAQVAMHENYQAQRQAGKNFSKHQGVAGHLRHNAGLKVDYALKEGNKLMVGQIEATVLYTPGHTSDSICLHLSKQRILLTGDNLMIGQCGRTDLPGGDPRQLYHSIFDVFAKLDDHTLVCPAHDYRGNVNTTIGYEKVNNPFFKTHTEDEFVAFAEKTFGELSPGDTIQCSVAPAADAAPTPATAAGASPLMSQMCTSMEYYFRTVPSHWNLISSQELQQFLNGPDAPLVLDVSTPQEFAEGHIPGALNIEVTQLPQMVGELAQYLEKPVVTVCASAVRSAYAALFLRGYGFSHVRTLEHGMYAWRKEALPLVTGQ